MERAFREVYRLNDDYPGVGDHSLTAGGRLVKVASD